MKIFRHGSEPRGRKKLAALSLTLTLSRREREKRSAAVCDSELRQELPGLSANIVLNHRRTILPLPAGEGRGEGETFGSKQRHSTPAAVLPIQQFNDLPRHSIIGFTLIEVILAIGIAAIVIISVSAVFFSAIRLRDATQEAVDDATPVNQAMDFLKRDLECVVTPTNGTSKLLSGAFRVGDITSSGNGEPVSIEMYTATAALGDSNPWGDIQRVTYELRNPTARNAQGKDLVRSVTRNLLTISTPQVEDQWLMSGVQSINFSCYDGSQWWNTWDTTGMTSANTNLPVAVRVDIQPVGNQMSPIEMVVPIDSQSRSNVVINAESTSGSGSGATSGSPSGSASGANSGR